MGYKVLARFEDTDGRVYKAGEKYSVNIDEKREAVLTTCANKYNRPFLERLGGNKPPNNSLNDKSEKDEAHYQDKTVKELKKVAKGKGLEFNSKVRKDDLIGLIITGGK